MKTKHRSIAAQWAQALLCWTLLCQPGPAVQAAADLADIPMSSRSSVNPNLILVVDDSGSMDWEITPSRGRTSSSGILWWHMGSRSFIGWAGTRSGTGVVDTWAGGGCSPALSGCSTPFDTNPPRGPINFNAAAAPSGTWRPFSFLFPLPACGANCDGRGYDGHEVWGHAVAPTREFGWTRSALYNGQYYNPAVTYAPWRPYYDGSVTVALPSYDNVAAPWTAVRSHPVLKASGTTGTALTLDLTGVVSTTDATAGNRSFVMDPGMILPAGVRYRICSVTSIGSTTSCSSTWNTAPSSDTCLVPTSTTSAAYCPFASAYGVTGTLNIGGTSRRVDVQIPYRPATYWVASTATGALSANEAYGPDGQRIRRIEITSTTASYPKASTRTDCTGSTCTYAEEMTNFANWFAYHRRRHQTVAGAMGAALDSLTTLRAGYFTFNNRNNVTMRDLGSTSDAANAKRLLGDLYRIKGNGSTPTRPALEHAGIQFRRTDSGAPINASCQSNAALIITDGFASGERPVANYGNVDALTTNRFTTAYTADNAHLNYTTAQPPGNMPPPPTDPLPSVSVVPVHPFADAESNTLADVAMHFYSTNLRPDLKKRQVPVNTVDSAPSADRNDYLHMNTYALGFGVQGLVFGQTDTAVNVQANQNPFVATQPQWLWPSVRNGGGYVEQNPATIDELWHATINGRGMMLSANSPDETRAAMNDIVNVVSARISAGAAVGIGNPYVAAGDNYSYASSYNPGPWSGDLNKYEVDMTTGAVNTTGLWAPSPQKQLAARPHGGRVIATYDGTAGIAFRWDNLTASQQSALTSTVNGVTAADPDVLDFIRGDRWHEATKFRVRGPKPVVDPDVGAFQIRNGAYVYPNNRIPDDVAVLGDIVHAEPVVVGAPISSYFEPGYQDFKVAKAARAGVVYQGANDGMLHAFSAVDGRELWAYVPGLVVGRLRQLSDRIAFTHKYYVDATPTTGDVDFARAGTATASAGLAQPDGLEATTVVMGSGGGTSGATTTDWRTLLVGGLRKGGFGYYALDVTDPSATSEAALAGKVLWEFPNAQTNSDDPTARANVGYSYGRPLIVKTRAAGWVVAVTSGYNNGTGADSSGGDGVGRVWILDPRNGRILRTLSTGVGTAASPSGIAQLAPFAQRPQIDPTVEALYGGDLLGNVWRFDLSGDTIASWYVAKLATLKTSGGQAQPVTTEPELGVIQGRRVVFVGTGQTLGESDVLNSPTENTSVSRRTNSVYALRDDPGHTSATNALVTGRSSMVQQTVTKSGDTANITSTAVNFTTSAGWFFDLPDVGERADTQPTLSSGVVVINTNIPNNADACNPGGSSWQYWVDYATGGRVQGVASAGRRRGSTISSRPVVIEVNGGIRILSRGGDATTITTSLPTRPTGSVGRRVSWRELTDAQDP
jgi:type IV pilus assembly protein PilY1